MAIIKWNAPDAAETVMTAALDNLVDGANKLSGVVSNDAAAELDLYGEWQLYLATQTAGVRETGGLVPMYIIPEIGGNYAYGSDSLDPDPNLQVGAFTPTDGATAAVYMHLRGIELPPTDFKIILENETGRRLAAGGNVLLFERYNLQSN